MADDSEIDRVLAQYGQGYTAPQLNSGDSEIYSTPNVMSQYAAQNEGVTGLLRRLATRVRGDSRPDNVLAGGMDTAANWLDGRPRVGEDTVAPLGMVGMGLPFAVPGAVGVFGGRLARTADQDALRRAEEMAAAGRPREDIWNATGWFQGVDGKWRFEIDDSPTGRFMESDQVYRPGAIRSRVADQSGRTQAEVADMGYQTHLADVLPHEELYRAYPDLGLSAWAALPPERLALPGYGGVWRGQQRGMEINNTISPSLDRGRSVTLHEVQHGIQDIEDFARGANREMFSSPERIAGGQRQAAEFADAEVVRSIADSEGISIPDAVKYVQQHFGVTPQGRAAEIAGMHSIEVIRRMQARIQELLDQSRDPARSYHRTAGEVEARNVQTRRDFSPEARKAIPPWKSQDVPDADQILSQYGHSLINGPR